VEQIVYLEDKTLKLSF